jgi:rhodanese-related sulfurtransferase
MKTKVLITLIAVFSIITFAQGQQLKQVTSKEAAQMLKSDKNLVIIDVRTAEEFKDGHIKGAINIDIRQPDAFVKIDKLNRNAKYVVHCRTNHRSQIAVDHMVQSGFKTIVQIMDGFIGWSQNGLPVVK